MSATQAPTVGRIVHYVARGSADGEHAKACRAAIVTEVNGHAVNPITLDEVDAHVVGLAVLNPTGLFLDRSVVQDDGQQWDAQSSVGPLLCDGRTHDGGTWHWPGRS